MTRPKAPEVPSYTSWKAIRSFPDTLQRTCGEVVRCVGSGAVKGYPVLLLSRAHGEAFLGAVSGGEAFLAKAVHLVRGRIVRFSLW